MDGKKFNFDIGNRRLTVNEAKAVEIAKRVFRDSFARHGRTDSDAELAVFKATAAPSETTRQGTETIKGNSLQKPPAADLVGTGSEFWTTNRVASAHRRY